MNSIIYNVPYKYRFWRVKTIYMLHKFHIYDIFLIQIVLIC